MSFPDEDLKTSSTIQKFLVKWPEGNRKERKFAEKGRTELSRELVLEHNVCLTSEMGMGEARWVERWALSARRPQQLLLPTASLLVTTPTHNTTHHGSISAKGLQKQQNVFSLNEEGGKQKKNKLTIDLLRS